VQALRELLAARGGVWQEAFVDSARLRAAVDQTMAQEQTPIHAGSEVAFFPPVTGG
jgi:molybdopterin synthase sulfur carrier subunit